MRNTRRLTAEQRRVLERHGLPTAKQYARRHRWRLTPMGKDILLSWFIIACLFFLLGFLMGAMVIELDGTAVNQTIPAVAHRSYPLAATEPATEPTREPEPISVAYEPTPAVQIATEEPVSAGIAFQWDTAVQNYVSLGEYKLTSYCSCEKCCGYWATIRPLDENGEPIVYTASGAIARQGVTVAADIDVLPFGTILLIGGEEFTVQDVGGGVNGKHIDIYFEDHQAAREFGVRYETIYREGGM